VPAPQLPVVLAPRSRHRVARSLCPSENSRSALLNTALDASRFTDPVLPVSARHRSKQGQICHEGTQTGALGSRGYLLKERLVDPLIIETLLAQPDSVRTLCRLTRRESEVLGELATGGSNRAVAQRLVLTQRAVEKHINSIFAKLGLTGDDSVDRRVKAVLMFLEDGVLRRGSASCRA
jgi:ATP/maltotriose-dependent transcriptional regulator MalT